MELQQYLVNVAHLKEIVTTQTQVRTNKLKPYIDVLEEAGNLFPAPAIEGAVTPNTDPEKETNTNREIQKLADFILKNYPDEPGKTGESESAVDVAIRLLSPDQGIAKENRYLKRKVTMYELNIAKKEQEVKKWRSMAKGSSDIGVKE